MGSLESRGLHGACSLFGHVLDCKIQHTGAKEEVSSCVGFVHYAAKEEAEKAMGILNGMQIGETQVEVRQFKYKDTQQFTGSHYSTHVNRELSAETGGAMPFQTN